MTAQRKSRSSATIQRDIWNLRKTLPRDQVKTSPELASLISEYRKAAREEGLKEIEQRIEMGVACFMRTDSIEP